MRRSAWTGIAACCIWGIACGGGGGGRDSVPDADVGPGAEDVGPADAPGEPGGDLPEPGAEAGEVAVDPGAEVGDAREAGPDAAEVPPCGEECSVTNEHGTCKGWRACVDGVPGECDAPTPEAEVCDGVDNDCDGGTDEDPAALCDDGVACTEDRCDGEAGCAHPVAPGACLIDGECYQVGDLSPHNECLFCLPETGNLDWSPRPGGCDDGNVCTTRDTCEAGACVGGENVCECEADADCAPHEDGNPCNGTLFCDHATYPAACEVDPATVVTCDPSQDTKCRANLCDPATGQCAMTPVFEGEACDDHEACTKEDRCGQGTCAGTAYSCDDQLPCTQDVCDGAGGCDYVLAPYYCVIGEPGAGAACVPHGEHHPETPCLWCDAQVQASGWSPWSGPCDDGDPCTAGDTCAGGECAGEPYACDDGLDCTIEACDGAGGCETVEVVADFCLIDGACVAAQERSPDNECLWCDPDTDDHAWSQNQLSCEDGNPCTTGDACVRGVCVGGPPPDCDDGDLCSDDRCDPSVEGGCVHVANTAPCDDGNPCTVGDACSGGECAPGPVNACECETTSDCPDDGDACNGSLVCDTGVFPHRCVVDPATVVTCDSSNDTACLKNRCAPATGECAMAPVNEGGACDDANACTYGEKCQGGACLGTGYDCNDGLLCTDDACRGDGTCDHALKSGFCLIAGTCVEAGAEDADNPCLVCDPSVQKYTWTAKQTGTSCDDGEACTHSDACKAGQCRGVAYGCDDLLACTDDACLGDGACSHTVEAGFCLIAGVCRANGDESGPCLYCNPTLNQTAWTARDGTVCDDGEACTKEDRCDGTTGQCAGTPYECDDGKWCTLDACLGDGTCDASVIAAGACLIDGACYGRGDEDPQDPCRRCVPETSQTAWTPRADGTACSDGDECTVNDRCEGGECVPGPARTCDDQSPCTEDRCDPQAGCIHEANDLFRVDFEDGAGFSFENSDPVVGWQVASNAPGSPSAFLYYGDPATGSYDTPGQANEGTALSEGVIQVASGQQAFLSFDLRLDNEWSNRVATGGQGRQWNDVLEVFLSIEGAGEVQVWSSSWGNPQWWVQTSNGVPVRPKPVRVSGVDLTSQLQWYGYAPFRIGFRFTTGDERLNDFGGVFVDNVVIGRLCADQDACTEGDSCQAGQCLGLPAVCDDANDCTEDSCDPEVGCQHPAANEQGACEDYDLCTEGTLCSWGWCGGGTPVVCEDDGNDCTNDACDPLAGCSYQPVPDFTECSQADPYGTCLGGTCVPWELSVHLAGDYATGFNAVERVEGGPLSVAGVLDPPNGDLGDFEAPAVFDFDHQTATWHPAGTEGELNGVSGGLAVGSVLDLGTGRVVPVSAAWDRGALAWTFDPGMNPSHVASDGDADLAAVTRAPGSAQYYAGGAGQVGDLRATIERCTWDEMTGGWLPCEAMAAFVDPWGGCVQFDSLEVHAMWAASDSAVWAAGTSLDQYGSPNYTILYYDGNQTTECGGITGFRGAFYQDWQNGLLQPSGGEGVLYGIHGRDWGNAWAVGTEGKVFARTGGGLGWQPMDPAAQGIVWDEGHTGYGVFVEERDVHIVGAIGDQVPFYLHARRTDDPMTPWVFDRKVVFWDLAGARSALNGVTRDPETGAVEAVGTRMDATRMDAASGTSVGLRVRLAASLE